MFPIQAQEQKPPESYILIQFSAPNSTVLNIKYENVSPLQAIAAAWVLQKESEATMQAQIEAQREQSNLSRIAVPGRSP